MAKIIMKLKNIAITNKAEGTLRKEDAIFIKFSLLHPNYGVQSIVSPWVVGYKKNPTLEIKKHLGGLLFKEIVEGPFQLQVEVLAIDHVSKFGEFLLGVLKAGAGAYLGVLTGGISIPVLSAMAGKSGESLLDSIFSDSDKTYKLGSGTRELDSEKLVSGTLEPLDLLVNNKVTRPGTKKPSGINKPGSGIKTKEILVVDKGINGSVVVDIIVKP